MKLILCFLFSNIFQSFDLQISHGSNFSVSLFFTEPPIPWGAYKLIANENSGDPSARAKIESELKRLST